LRVDATVTGAPAESLARIDEAESLGLDRVLVTETAHDPFPLLAVAGQRTARVELGTGVAIAFARTPMTLAYSAWDLQTFTGGRAVIGLGSQVRAHVERRFGMPWSRPAARMREFVLATRAIWRSWQAGERLEFQGEFYRHTLMPAPFDPGPLPEGAAPPRLLVAAVGPRMARAAGEVGDGILCHPLTTPDHLRRNVLPDVYAARRASSADGAAWAQGEFEVCGGVLAAVGRDDRELEAAIAGVRERIAFYASTPGYEGVLEARGWGALHTELHGLSRAGRWAEMGRLIDDEVFDAFAVSGSPAQAAREIDARYRGVLDRVSVVLARKADLRTGLGTLLALKALGSE
jgi:probable F420-dependent oxidoreductase